MGIKERLRRLEERHRGTPGAYEVPLYMDVFFKELENDERREAGLEEIPYTEEELAYIREADERLLTEYIPYLKGTACSEESRAVVEQLEAHIREGLERLSEATREGV